MRDTSSSIQWPLRLLFVLAATTLAVARAADRAPDAKHSVVYHQPRQMAAWPANSGLWTWDEGDEALVGFCVGAFKEQPGHNILPPYTNLLARSCDGGETWRSELPAGYAQETTPVRELTEPVDFTRPGFALRTMAAGYHGSTNARGGFLYSYDRGRSWSGPFHLAGLDRSETLRDWEITARTDYVANSAADCLFLLSGRRAAGRDRLFAARTRDGGRQFEFTGWVIGLADPFRAVMSATVRCSPSKLVTAIRRREQGVEHCWIDAYVSEDNGLTWKFLSQVGDTGKGNGNPPALIRLRDGRLCCVYGHRDRNQMLARFTTDHGATWTEEIVLRDDYRADRFGNSDLGYPRIFQRRDERLVAIYYWADAAHPEPHIAATIWQLSKQP
jgi:hypothetical protein